MESGHIIFIFSTTDEIEKFIIVINPCMNENVDLSEVESA
jgi:hypothetical protein